MADLQDVSQVIAQVAYAVPDRQRVSQVIAQVAYTEPNILSDHPVLEATGSITGTWIPSNVFDGSLEATGSMDGYWLPPNLYAAFLDAVGSITSTLQIVSGTAAASGPWVFIPQGDKYGYVNNPNWAANTEQGFENVAVGPWPTIKAPNLSQSIRHLPCGYWHHNPGKTKEKLYICGNVNNALTSGLLYEMNASTGVLKKSFAEDIAGVYKTYYKITSFGTSLYTIARRTNADYSNQYSWIVEKYSNKILDWRVEHNLGNATDIAVNENGVFVCGSDFDALSSNLYTRLERRDRTTGALLQTVKVRRVGNTDTDYELATSLHLYGTKVYVCSDSTKSGVNNQRIIRSYLQTDLTPDAEISDAAKAFPLPPLTDYGTTMLMDRGGVLYSLNSDGLYIFNTSLVLAIASGYNVQDYYTTDLNILADDTGLYLQFPLPYVNSANVGYRVAKYTFAGVLIWYTDHTAYSTGTTYSTRGVAVSDMVLSGDNLYLVGYAKLNEMTYDLSLRQSINKTTGAINWTLYNTAEYFWGITTP